MCGHCNINKDHEEVEEGRFREDLFYRLNVASVRIPPLRNRREDVGELAKTFLAEFCRRFTRQVPLIAPEALQYLEQLPWKGNVRELRNAMERVVLLNNVPVLSVEHFGFLRASGTLSPSTSGNGKSFMLEIPLRESA
jgi:DNA-binding NtrC family response regulator